MTAKEHYAEHLGNFYSWMVGDFAKKQTEQQDFFEKNYIVPSSTKIAIDLGAGHGIQSISLAKLGFNVTAIDFNQQLLSELKHNSKGLTVKIIEDDIRCVAKYDKIQPEIIACCGDTLTHLQTIDEVREFVTDCCRILVQNGKLVFSYRDYSTELSGNNRFIHVKSDENKILTCFLEYQPLSVSVTDLIYLKSETGWQQKVSSYEKLRLSPSVILELLRSNGMTILFSEPVNGLITVIAIKQN